MCAALLPPGVTQLRLNISYIIHHVAEFISIFYVILSVYILYRQIMLDPKPIYVPALCDVKPTCLSCDVVPSVLE
jgi:hypothetical protein